MIAYFTDAYNTFFPLLCHRLGVNKDKKAVLFIDENQCSKRASNLNFIFEELVNQQIFDDVVPCEMTIKIADLSEAEAEKNIVDNFDNIFANHGYNVNDFEAFYSTNDTWGGYQNIYLNIKKVKYYWIQPATDKTHSIPGDFNCECYKNLMNKYKAMSVDSDYSIPCVLSSSQKTISELKEKGKEFIIWNKQECFDGLSYDTRQRLYRAFHLDESAFNSCRETKTLMIKNGFGYLWWILTSFYPPAEQWHKFYSYGEIFSAMDKLLVDLFANDCKKIFLKYHIHYCLDDEDSKRIYDDNTISLPNIPMEIVLKYFSDNNIKFDKIISVASTSTEGLPENIYDKFYATGTDLAQVWWYYISIYIAVLFAENQNFSKIYCNQYLISQLKLIADEIEYFPEFVQIDVSSISKIEDSLIIIDMLKYPNFNLNSMDKSSSAVLLNFENSASFYKANRARLVPIVINKEQVENTECDFLSRKEAICVYSANSAVNKSARNFSFEKYFKQLGMKVSVSKSTVFDSQEYLDMMKQRNEIKELRETVQNQSKQLRFLNDYIKNPEAMDSALTNTVDLDLYLDILKFIQKKYLILIAVRDTATTHLSDISLKKIFDLGFTNFVREGWTAYAGASLKSSVLLNVSGNQKNVPIDFKLDANGSLSIELSSKPFKAGNRASIKINGFDYAVNKRGINIVVFDTDNMKLIDSVAFDTHVPDCSCSRSK